MRQSHTVHVNDLHCNNITRQCFTRFVFVIAILCSIRGNAFSQGVAINTSGAPADTSAMLDVSSVTKGMLIPRMTKAQRNAIPLPATGLMVYQTDSTVGLYLNAGTPISPEWAVFGGDGSGNTAVGVNTLSQNNGGAYNTSIGNSALFNNINGVGNTATGEAALYSNTGGLGNTAVGRIALYNNTTGTNNTASGYNALGDNTTASDNTATGAGALAANTTGNQNTATGTDALFHNTTGVLNTATGYFALSSNTTGYHNCADGYRALEKNTTAYHNAASGFQALRQNTTGAFNTAIGANALSTNITGSSLTAIGNLADVSIDGLTDATAIGNGAKVGASFTMVLGDGNVVRWGFGVNAAAGRAIEVGTNGANGNGAYLTTGGVWTNASDRNKKENFTSIDGEGLLKKIDQLPITMWNYKGESKEIKHIGPMAQDFSRIFNVGNDDKSISTIDPAGIALAAIQAIEKKSREQQHLIEVLTAENLQLRKTTMEINAKLNLIVQAIDHHSVTSSVLQVLDHK